MAARSEKLTAKALVTKTLPVRPPATKMDVLDKAVGRHDDLLARRRLPDAASSPIPNGRQVPARTSAGSDSARSSISPNSPTSRTRRSSVTLRLSPALTSEPASWGW